MLAIIKILFLSNFLLITLNSFKTNFNKHQISNTRKYYDYFKKNKDGEKKDIGRLWKNIIFPGIY